MNTKSMASFLAEMAKDNREAIYRYFVENPCSKNYAVADALGLHEITVGRHAKAIREGWRPGDDLHDFDQKPTDG